MKTGRVNMVRIIVYVVLALVVYSFLPMISFLFVKGAPAEENNQAAIRELGGNKGVYFSFIVLGDNHNGMVFNDSATLKLIWQMNREDRFRKVPIDFVLDAGDVSLDGNERHFKAYKKMQALIKYPVISAIGNHDDEKLFREYCGEADVSFVNRNSYFILLNNSRGDPAEERFEWFEEELKKGQSYDHIFVTLHKPPFDPYQQEWYNEDNSPWAYRFRKLCAAYGVDMVFSGHKHMFKHAEFDGVDYIVSGGGGMLIEIPESDGGYLHYVRVMVNNDYVTYEVRKVTPPFWEILTYYMWKELLYKFRDFYGTGYIFGRNSRILPIREDRVNDEKYWFPE
ncbi:MAG: metallophosphoesterase family protein [Candidatus Omnitrophica bacterium]|nr:metallophosphoesterase family protein [Candidatus Omnitrophota bacterium]MDD5488045.1 metallophosphoesterase family protein [Candidatus Omnitrophota bacterium]